MDLPERPPQESPQPLKTLNTGSSPHASERHERLMNPLAVTSWRGNHRARWIVVLALLTAPLTKVCNAQAIPSTQPFLTLVAHWANYNHAEYLDFIDEAQPDLAQVGFYGAHFWGLASTEHGGGYPAHLPVRGLQECGAWFEWLNREIHQRHTKVIGHMNVKFLIGDLDSEAGPRGFFDFYQNHWNPDLLGPRPEANARDLLELDRDQRPRESTTYRIGGMKEYWACLVNPSWREVLKRWVKAGIERGLDGFIVNYFYRHDCHCQHCQQAFRQYLGQAFSKTALQAMGIRNLETHSFPDIGAWHDPKESTPLRRAALRFSQIANQEAFQEVFVEYGRSLKPDLTVAQWNHLGDFGQISGDEKCLLPGDLWGPHEDYFWYSTGGAANFTKLAEGMLGEGTLQGRYLQGATEGKPYTLGKYEHVRIRAAIAELAANGGMPMGFYTRFTDPLARAEIVRYYRFLSRNRTLFLNRQPYSEAILLYPRTQIHEGNLEGLERFKKIGRFLLDQHVLFEVLPDDSIRLPLAPHQKTVIDPKHSNGIERSRRSFGSRFSAPQTTRVSASRSEHSLTLHFVNYDRREKEDGSMGAGIADEKPIATPPISVDFQLPAGARIGEAFFLTPEAPQAIPLTILQTGQRLRLTVPSFLVYGLVDLRLQ